MNFKEVDLDILRGLNETNINDNPSLRDSFFKSLMEVEFCHSLEQGIIEEEKQKVEYSYKNTYTDEKMVSCELSEELCNVLVGCMVYTAPKMPISNRDDVLKSMLYNYIEVRHVAKRICIIQYLYNIIKINSCSFFGLKAALLKGLIINCCKDLSSFEKKQRLNKMIVMYAEHVKGVQPFEEIPMIIDDEFLGNIYKVLNNPDMESEFYSNGIWDEAYRFIQRKFSQHNRKICKHGRRPFSTF